MCETIKTTKLRKLIVLIVNCKKLIAFVVFCDEKDSCSCVSCQ